MKQETIYRARWVLPITSPPIENAAIAVREKRITKVGRFDALRANQSGEVIDLGDVAVLPGLVNAHTHLEFSDLDAPVGAPGIELADWIGEVIRHRGNVEPSLDTIATGLAECKRTGTVLLGEIATTPWLHDSETNQVDVLAFAETLGLTQARGDAKLQLAQQHLERLGITGGISPHAPYSTPPALIEACVDLARRTDSIVAMHVAESIAERELLLDGTGPFAENLQRLGLPIEGTFPWKSSDPLVELIRMLARSPAALLVHGNDLRDHELDELTRYANLSVVYCPRTHHFFGHRPHRVDKMQLMGINVALGTDSRASNPDLNLWGEIQFLLNHRQDIDPQAVLAMGTLNGAKALRRANDFGSLESNRRASWICVPTDASDIPSMIGHLATGEPFTKSL